MKLRWKIALGLLGTIVLIGGGGLTYILKVSPPPAKLVEPGPTGRRIDTGGLLANFYHDRYRRTADGWRISYSRSEPRAIVDGTLSAEGVRGSWVATG